MTTEPMKKAVGLLAKLTWLFRPATLKVTDTTVVISQDVATIHHTATVDRGLLLWFVKGGTVDFPIPSGLNLGTEIDLRCEDLEADYRGVDLAGMVAKIGKAAKESGRAWKRGEKIHVEVKTHCESRELFEVFPSDDGEYSEVDGEHKTTFKIRKKASFRDVFVKRFRWCKTLTGLLPLKRIDLLKNGQPSRDTQVDVLYTWRSIAEVGKVQVSKIEPPIESRSTQISCRVEIPLSFEDAEDEYTIILCSAALEGHGCAI